MNEMSSGNAVIDRHFALHNRIWDLARLVHAGPDCRAPLITACKEQIAIAVEAAQAYLPLMHGAGLPMHLGFERLAMINEKNEDYVEAIRLCETARDMGWRGDWDEDIERLTRLLAEQQKKAAPLITVSESVVVTEPAITQAS